MRWQGPVRILFAVFLRIIGMNLRSAIHRIVLSITTRWCRRCWAVEEKRVVIVNTCVRIVARICGGFALRVRAVFVCRVPRGIRMILWLRSAVFYGLGRNITLPIYANWFGVCEI
jgi:hypothetical protein